jgi:hypothetical protein
MKVSSRTSALVIVGLAICLYGAHRLFSSTAEKQEIEKDSLISPSVSSPSDDFQNERNSFSKKNENSKDIKQLMAEISSLRQQVAQLAVTTQAKTEANKPEEKNNNLVETMFDPKMVEKSKKEHQEKMESLEDKFYSEPEDSKWSSSALSAIREALQPNEVMRSAVRKIECHSTMCRLELADDQSKAFESESIDAFSQNLTPDLSRVIVHRADEGHGKQTVILYVSRENMLAPNR